MRRSAAPARTVDRRRDERDDGRCRFRKVAHARRRGRARPLACMTLAMSAREGITRSVCTTYPAPGRTGPIEADKRRVVLAALGVSYGREFDFGSIPALCECLGLTFG